MGRPQQMGNKMGPDLGEGKYEGSGMPWWKKVYSRAWLNECSRQIPWKDKEESSELWIQFNLESKWEPW